MAVSTDLARHVYFLRLIPLFFFLFALCRCLSPSLALGCFFRWSRCSLFFLGFPLSICPLFLLSSSLSVFSLARSPVVFCPLQPAARPLPLVLHIALHIVSSSHACISPASYAILDITSVSHLIDFLSLSLSPYALRLWPVFLSLGQQYSPFAFRLPVRSHPGNLPPSLLVSFWRPDMNCRHRTLQHTTQTEYSKFVLYAKTKTKEIDFFRNGRASLSLVRIKNCSWLIVVSEANFPCCSFSLVTNT